MNDRTEQPESEPEGPAGEEMETSYADPPPVDSVDPESPTEVSSNNDSSADTTEAPERIEIATVVSEGDVSSQPSNMPEVEIRYGSPFAIDPLFAATNRPIEPFYDVGPIRYTAMGAVAASVMVMVFGLVAVWWFPSGGALIAALGCVLSIFGMYSAFRGTAVGLLAVHLILFVLSYGRSIG
ncbi:MAG: hypothetical protein AAGG48_01685 [Planctomycetota bacterium]